MLEKTIVFLTGATAPSAPPLCTALRLRHILRIKLGDLRVGINPQVFVLQIRTSTKNENVHSEQI